jgi:dihydroflavonol-4-reductase
MKTLVTGATGLVGGNLVRALLDGGHQVRVLVRPTSDASTLRGLAVERLSGDVLEAASLHGVADGCEVVFHAAAVFAYWGYTRGELEEIAVRGTCNVLAAARAAGVRRVVMTSSSVVLGSGAGPGVRDEDSRQNEPNPSSYTLSKMRQEQAALELARELDLDLVVVCPTLTVGGHDYRLSPSNGSLVNYLNDPLRSTFLGGCNIVSARDVATGHLIAAARGARGARYVLGSENLHWREVHGLISQLGGTFGPSLTLNNTATYLMASMVETSARLVGIRPAVTRDEAAMAGRFYWYSSAALARLGYAPRPSREALAEALAWLIHRAYLNESVIDGLAPDPLVTAHHEAYARGEG